MLHPPVRTRFLHVGFGLALALPMASVGVLTGCPGDPSSDDAGQVLEPREPDSEPAAEPDAEPSAEPDFVPDSGSPFDGGDVPDANVVNDAGSIDDAGSVDDAGSIDDAGTGDAGAAIDGGLIAVDGGPQSDGGLDAGVTVDGGNIGGDAGVGGGLNVCDIVENVFSQRCVSCHDGNFQFDLREDAARTQLVGAPSGLYQGETLVVAGDVEGSLLYQKLVGGLESGLGGTMPPGSFLEPQDIALVADWIAEGASTTCEDVEPVERVYLDTEAHLRRIAMALLGERPSADDYALVRANPAALDGIIDGYMNRKNFGETIRDLHNDALLVRTTMLFQLLYPAIGPLRDLAEADATWADAKRINNEVMEAPLRTAEYIVATDRPYTEIVTGNYVVGNEAFTAIYGDGTSGTQTWYGFFETTGPQGAAYDRSEDPYGLGPAEDFDVFEWVDGRGAAGLISSNAMMSRWQSAGASYQRGRANAVTKAFLCHDFLANPVDVSSSGGIDLSDPDSVAQAVQSPSTSCWGCHAALDPIATYLQPFRPVTFAGSVGTDGYPYSMYSDLFHFGEGIVGIQNGRVPGYFAATAETPNPPSVDINLDGRIDVADLGQFIAEDPRFAACTVKRFYSFFLQTERSDISASTQSALEQVFVGSNHNAKQLIKAILMSDEFRTSHTATEVGAEDINGILRARPSQMARLYQSTTGLDLEFANDFPLELLAGVPDVNELVLPYGLTDYFRDDFIGFRELAGGIDGFTVNRPVTTFTGGTGSAYRWIGNFGGWYSVTVEGARPLAGRQLLTVADFTTAIDEASVRLLLVEVHQKLIGNEETPQSAAIDESYGLWTDLFAISGGDAARAWSHVVSALLQDVRTQTY